VIRIHDILVRIRIRGSMPLTNTDPDSVPDADPDSDPDADPKPALFEIDLQDVNKNII
jgi:hypothetical protein